MATYKVALSFDDAEVESMARFFGETAPTTDADKANLVTRFVANELMQSRRELRDA